MKSITEEKRQALIAHCHRVIATYPPASMEVASAHIALASLEAEPVATRCRYHSAPQSNEIWLYIPQESYSPDTTGNYQEQPLYTALPVPVVNSVSETNRLNWLESMNTLHGTVEILYVVDGYQLTYVYHDCQIGGPVHGETLAQAIDNAMSAGWKPMNRAAGYEVKE